MKKFKIFTLCALGLATVALTACSDQSDEITEVTLSRNLSPINLEAKNVQETSASIQWTTSAHATSYNLRVYADDSLSYSAEKELAKEINGITPEQIPVNVDGLLFDTQYTVYVQAITDNDDSRTSKWNGAYFKTSAKQFLKNPQPYDISDSSVTLSWEVEDGFDVSTIVIGDITHEITEEEKEAGKATIEGLKPETTYTAYLYYNGKQCGKRSFTTIADIEGAILVHEGDDLKDIIENAEENAVFALYGGTYELNANSEGKTGAVKVSKTITIKGVYPTDRPIVKGRFELHDGAGLTLSQVKINGKDNSSTDQIFNYKTAGVTYGALDVQNSEISGPNGCKGLLYLNVQATVEAINFNNCIIHDIECSGGDFIDSRLGYPKKITLTNSTFYTVATSRDFIRVDDKSSDFPGVDGPVVTVDHCTMYKVGSGSANYRIFYLQFNGNKVTFTNNIVVETNYKRGFTNQDKTDQSPTLLNNYYFKCDENLTKEEAGVDAGVKWCDKTGVIDDPKFKDAANANFTLDADAAANKGKAGDPRWWTGD